MTDRVLPRDEFWRLNGTECEAIAPVLPADARVIVVEDADHVIGCWSLFRVLHAEGLFIAPEHRGRAAVGRRLLRAMRRNAREMGAPAVATSAIDPRVEAMLTTLGAVRLPGVHVSMGV